MAVSVVWTLLSREKTKPAHSCSPHFFHSHLPLSLSPSLSISLIHSSALTLISFWYALCIILFSCVSTVQKHNTLLSLSHTHTHTQTLKTLTVTKTVGSCEL